MKLLLFLLLTICIAGSKTQEIVLGTDYLRTDVNESLSSQSALNAQIIELSPPRINTINPDQSSTNIFGSTVTTRTSTIDDDSPENDDDKTTKTYDHDHGATITIDVHNILEIFKEQIHQTEERILAAIQHEQSKNIPKSYRTADRF